MIFTEKVKRSLDKRHTENDKTFDTHQGLCQSKDREFGNKQ